MPEIYLTKYLEDQGASDALLNVLDDAKEAGDLPHETMEAFQDDLEAMDKYSQIDGMTAKLLYELDSLVGELDDLSNTYHAESAKPMIEKIKEPIFDCFSRLGASDELLDAIVTFENKHLLPHKTVEAVKADGQSAIHKYKEFEHVHGRVLMSELETLICQIIPRSATESRSQKHGSEREFEITAELHDLGASEKLLEAIREIGDRGGLPHENLLSFYTDGDGAIERYEGLEEMTGRTLYELEDLLTSEGVREEFVGPEYVDLIRTTDREQAAELDASIFSQETITKSASDFSIPEASIFSQETFINSAPNLSELELAPEYRSDKNSLVHDFFEPCLEKSTFYDRAVGYFTSSSLSLVLRGLKSFNANSGKIRLVASPLLEERDFEAMQRGTKARKDVVEHALMREFSENSIQEHKDRFELLAWLIATGQLEIKLAIPIDSDRNIRVGIYHEKIGIFTDEIGNSVAFTGSPNETYGGLISNFESIDVYWSWDDPHKRVNQKQLNFERLWNDETLGVETVELPQAVKNGIIRLRKSGPVLQPESEVKSSGFLVGLWDHQIEAVKEFLQKECGILEMATGTGKTRIALAIAESLLQEGKIETIIIAADGRDLLDQWGKDVLTLALDIEKSLVVYKQYDKNRELDQFLLLPEQCILLTTRYFLPRALRRIPSQVSGRILLIHDEVHALGSPGNRKSLEGLAEDVSYRLGLSATPEREYDEKGNEFILDHIGPTIYQYGLREAIEDGILSPFDYQPLEYLPDEEDGERISSIYKKVAARKQEGRPMTKAEIWTDIARVYKTSKAKLPIFSTFLRDNSEVLERCIIFVETLEYGEEVLSIVHRYKPDFHTYYGGEDKSVLERFARGDLECLITCHRLSEGIDIRSLKNVILFSSSRARLETIQRIGRCLRIDPDNPGKRAGIVDFVRADQIVLEVPDDNIPTDRMRMDWLTDLSKVR